MANLNILGCGLLTYFCATSVVAVYLTCSVMLVHVVHVYYYDQGRCLMKDCMSLCQLRMFDEVSSCQFSPRGPAVVSELT